MSSNLSKGPVQVMDNSVISINDALRQLQDRLDGIDGLRGRGRTYDRLGVNAPTGSADAATLGTVQNPQFSDGTAAAPSQSYKDDIDTGQFRIGANNEGFSAGGVLRMDYDTTRLRIQLVLDHDGTQVGFYNTTPVNQSAASANLTDNSGGAADDTIAAITNANNPGSADVVPTQNAIADVAAKVNKALTVLRDVGLMAT